MAARGKASGLTPVVIEGGGEGGWRREIQNAWVRGEGKAEGCEGRG